jgi:hypothetical protein
VASDFDQTITAFEKDGKKVASAFGAFHQSTVVSDSMK